MSLIDLIERLRYESEGDALDFKSAQYPFVGATDEEKSEFLKDILAMANAWRRTDAYILVGFREVKGGRAEVIGLAADLDDAQLQQFVNSKTQRPLRFSYSTFEVEGQRVAVLQIPIQRRPFYLNRKYGGLEPDTVYVRRGSSTAIARPDEVAQMGGAPESSDDVSLQVFFFDPKERKQAEPKVESCVLEIPSAKGIPDYTGGSDDYGVFRMNERREFYRELAKYTKTNRLVAPVWLAITNNGTSTAHGVRLELSITGANTGICVLDRYDYPQRPQQQLDLVGLSMPRSPSPPPDLRVDRVGNDWVVTGSLGKVQPKATEWFNDSIYLGARQDCVISCRVKVFADNLPAPYETTLTVPVTSRTEKADLNRIRELEQGRIEASPEFQEYVRKLTEDE